MTDSAKPNFEVEPTTESDLSRRGFVEKATALALGGFAFAQTSARAAIVRTDFSTLPP